MPWTPWGSPREPTALRVLPLTPTTPVPVMPLPPTPAPLALLPTVPTLLSLWPLTPTPLPVEKQSSTRPPSVVLVISVTLLSVLLVEPRTRLSPLAAAAGAGRARASAVSTPRPPAAPASSIRRERTGPPSAPSAWSLLVAIMVSLPCQRTSPKTDPALLTGLRRPPRRLPAVDSRTARAHRIEGNRRRDDRKDQLRGSSGQ